VQAFVSESDVTVAVAVRFERGVDDPHVGFQIREARGEPLFMTNTHCMRMRIGPVRGGEEVLVKFRFRGAFAPGDYSITAGVANGGLLDGHFREPLARVQHARAFSVLQNMQSILWAGAYNVAPVCEISRASVNAPAI
jgi:lipopolysaccharide transport system ATP-binding protein